MSAPGGFRLLEHTADLRLLVYGPTRQALFEAAGLGLLAIMGEDGVAGEPRPVSVRARDWEGLLVAWLNELVYLAAAGGGPPAACGVSGLGEDSDCWLDGWVGPPSPWRMGEVEVKAATYHGLEVHPPSPATPPGVPAGCWWAEVILDI